MAKGKRVSVTLDEGLWAWTKVNAEKRRWSRSKFIMQIVRNARKREEEEHKKKPSWLARLWNSGQPGGLQGKTTYRCRSRCVRETPPQTLRVKRPKKQDSIYPPSSCHGPDDCRLRTREFVHDYGYPLPFQWKVYFSKSGHLRTQRGPLRYSLCSQVWSSLRGRTKSS